jgi:hypothetical protein
MEILNCWKMRRMGCFEDLKMEDGEDGGSRV